MLPLQNSTAISLSINNVPVTQDYSQTSLSIVFFGTISSVEGSSNENIFLWQEMLLLSFLNVIFDALNSILYCDGVMAGVSETDIPLISTYSTLFMSI